MRARLYGGDPEDFNEERAYFDLGEGRSTFSEDGTALYVPVLCLTPATVRKVVLGGTLFHHLNGLCLTGYGPERDYSRWTYVWGSFRLYETGLPVIARAILLEGAHPTPDVREVMRHVRSRLFDRGS